MYFKVLKSKGVFFLMSVSYIINFSVVYQITFVEKILRQINSKQLHC